MELNAVIKMPAAFSARNRIELTDPTFAGSLQAYSGLHAMSPILIGFTLPCIGIALLAPRTLAGLQLTALALLVLAALAATVLFIVSVFSSGRIAGIVVDPVARNVEIISIGTFARRVEVIACADVATLRVASHYDRDGYKSLITELVLKSGDAIILPMLPSEAELKAVRIALAAGR